MLVVYSSQHAQGQTAGRLGQWQSPLAQDHKLFGPPKKGARPVGRACMGVALPLTSAAVVRYWGPHPGTLLVLTGFTTKRVPVVLICVVEERGQVSTYVKDQ